MYINNQMLGQLFIQKYIKNNELEQIPVSSLDQKKYPLYNDGTTYYKSKEGLIYRINLNDILFLSPKTGEWISRYSPIYRSIYGPCLYSN